jgi:hypothetical protein
MKIEDGKGQGVLAKVNSSNKLEVDSINHPVDHWLSHTQAATYNITTDDINTGAVATELPIFYIKHSGTTKTFNIEDIAISHNGANAGNFLQVRMYANSDAPTANNTSFTAHNVNLGSSAQASLEMYKWDEVGSGMTVASNGILDSSWIFGDGFSRENTQGHPVITPDKSLLFTVQSLSTSDIKLTITIRGYFL